MQTGLLPEYERRLLLAEVLGISLSELLRRQALGVVELTDQQQVELQKLIQKRLTGIPLQYLLGTVNFAGVELRVGPGVFIPRPETEQMLELIHPQAGDALLDLCAGSGAIGLAFLRLVPELQVTLVEKSTRAFKYLEANSSQTTASPLLQNALEHTGQYDWIVINPPYIPSGETLTAEATYDPKPALFSGRDGLRLPKLLLRHCLKLLTPAGTLVMEHHPTQQTQLIEYALKLGYQSAIGVTDLNQRPRFIVCKLN